MHGFLFFEDNVWYESRNVVRELASKLCWIKAMYPSLVTRNVVSLDELDEAAYFTQFLFKIILI